MSRGVIGLAVAVAVAAVAGGVWWSTRGTTLLVDADAPAAGASGTAEAPFSTITAAVGRAERLTADGKPVTIRVAPGTYRESVVVGGSHDHAALVLEGAGPEEVVVSGADVLTDWAPLRQAGQVLVHDWEHDWGLAELPTQGWEDYFADNDVSDIARRQEAVWVGGEVMRQVLTRDEVIAEPGTFHVDEVADEIVLHPTAPLQPGTVEVTARETGVHIADRRDVTLRGLTVERVGTALQNSGVELSDSTDVTVENARMLWNSWGGLGLSRVRGAVVRDVSTSSNGVIGLSVYRTEDADILDVENSRNNTWRGVWAGYLGWETGAKVFQGRRIRFRGWVAKDNAAGGLWLDTDITDVTIEEALLAHNLRAGLFLEAIQGPVVVRDVVICGNGEDGVVDGKSDRVTIANSHIYGNAEAQVLFSGAPGGRPFTTYDTQAEVNVRSEGWTLRGNTIAAGQDAKLVESHLDPPDWDIVTATLTSDSNTWTAPEPFEFHAAGDAHDFDGWRALTGQDTESTFAMRPPPQDCPS